MPKQPPSHNVYSHKTRRISVVIIIIIILLSVFIQDGLMMGDQEDNQDAVEVMLVAYSREDGIAGRSNNLQQNSIKTQV